MSLQEIQKEVAQLSAEERAALRRHLDQLDFFSDAKVMEEWTRNNRAAETGAVVPRDAAIAQLQAAGKRLDRPFSTGMPESRYFLADAVHRAL